MDKNNKTYKNSGPPKEGLQGTIYTYKACMSFALVGLSNYLSNELINHYQAVKYIKDLNISGLVPRDFTGKCTNKYIEIIKLQICVT